MPERIAPAESPFAPEVQQMLDRINPPGAPSVLALFRVMVKHPALADRMRTWGGYFLSSKATLTVRDREIVINRVCARSGAEYEWGVHVAAFGKAAGFTRDQNRAIADPEADDSALSERDRLIVRIVDSLHDCQPISDEMWASMVSTWSEQQILELLMLAGWYHSISYICTTLRLPLESWGAKFSDFADTSLDRG